MLLTGLPEGAEGRPSDTVRLTAGLGVMARIEKLAELLNRETGIANNTAKGEGVDRVVTKNCQDAQAIRHDDVLALAHDRKTGLLEGAHSV
jgi:hypothetical protein